ncbi:hypothetical protein ACIQF6_28270 [Kitasatospora sp. NPDC092948]|uniref:hypothetical protein n=1 Tax=Kitasatospora sp. NPDC092948 TaxID=3364088 RepID=UPI0038294CDF
MTHPDSDPTSWEPACPYRLDMAWATGPDTQDLTSADIATAEEMTNTPLGRSLPGITRELDRYERWALRHAGSKYDQVLHIGHGWMTPDYGPQQLWQQLRERRPDLTLVTIATDHGVGETTRSHSGDTTTALRCVGLLDTLLDRPMLTEYVDLRRPLGVVLPAVHRQSPLGYRELINALVRRCAPGSMIAYTSLAHTPPPRTPHTTPHHTDAARVLTSALRHRTDGRFGELADPRESSRAVAPFEAVVPYPLTHTTRRRRSRPVGLHALAVAFQVTRRTAQHTGTTR